jgi:general secretion pathway protein E
VEYKIDGLNQFQVKPEIGLDFARILRSVLRHDPDVIMVGEIRDGETARIAMQAALTGHLVLSTLHTNDAASAVTRLLDMGVEDYLVASTVTGVLAQRLVRNLCPACRVRTELPTAISSSRRPTEAHVHRAVGCDACRGTGYRGRSVISELLTFDDALRLSVLAHEDAARMRGIAMQAGMESLYDNGIKRVLEGLTSYDEVIRVAQDVG